MDSSDAWYRIDEQRLIDSPALIIHTDRVMHNIDQMLRIAVSPEKLMPHIKTYKLPQVVEMQMEAGIYQFKCATIAEAELLGLVRARRALMAYQPSEAKVYRLIGLIKNYPDTRYATLIDNMLSAEMIHKVLDAHGMVLDVYMDINNGNNRTGIIPQKAVELYRKCLGLKAINVLGLHVYDGHIRNPDAKDRKEACDQAYEPVRNLIHVLKKKFHYIPEVIAGGSPTFTIHAQRENVICSPGTTLFWDAGYASAFPDLPFLPAAVVITRVVSTPINGLLCLDLGHKSIASENPIENRVRFLNAPGLVPVGHSEEHLTVKNTKNVSLKPGDVVYGLPYHICPTTALYNEVMVVQAHKIIDQWEVLARTRKINY